MVAYNYVTPPLAQGSCELRMGYHVRGRGRRGAKQDTRQGQSKLAQSKKITHFFLGNSDLVKSRPQPPTPAIDEIREAFV